MRHHLAGLLVGIVVLLLAPRSRAGSVEIVTTGGTPWAQLVEQIQDDTGSQGRVYSLVVRDGGELVGCNEYQLSLDPVAAAAFRVEGCEVATSATALRVVHREALFDAGEIVPRARRATVSATIQRRASAAGGGAPAQAGSKIWCSVALQPYLFDRLRGQPVPLMPDRFVLRPVEAHIQAAPDGAGWIARGESRFALRFHYEVVDIHTGSKVLENEASLVCADAPAGASEWAQVENVAKAREALAPLPSEPPPPAPTPLAWVISLDMPPSVGWTLVGTMLVRPLADVVFSDGLSASKIYGGARAAVLGGSTVGFTYRRGALFFPMRITVAADAQVIGVSAFAGVGGAWSPGPDTTLYAAVAPRFTSLIDYNAGDGFFNRFDATALFGIRHRLWVSLHRKPSPEVERCAWGFEPFVEAAAPLASAGVWFVSGGFSQWWGPGGGYFGGVCGRKRSSR